MAELKPCPFCRGIAEGEQKIVTVPTEKGETMAEYGDRIFKILHQFNKKAHIPDLHSFTAKIKNGFVFVECRGYEVMMESRTYDENGIEKASTWCGTTVAAANRLEMLKLDIDTISY